MTPFTLGPNWSRAVALALCAGATVFVGGAVLQFIDRIAPVLGLFFGGWLVSSALEPGVTWLARHSRLTRASAVAVNYLVVLVFVCLAWLGLSANISSGLSLGFRALPPRALTLQQRALQLQDEANAWLAEHGLTIHLDVGSRLSIDSLARQMLDQFLDAPWGAVAIASNATSAIASIGLVLLLSVYFLTGGPQLVDFLARLCPPAVERELRFVLDTLHDAFGGFFRSQAAQAAIFAGGTWACLAFMGIDEAPLVAGAAGLLLLIPMVGGPLALIPPIIATLVWRPEATVVVVATLAVFQTLVLNVLGPRLMSRQLGLPPLLVLFAILVGAQVAGLWGAILGVPTVSAALTMLVHFRTPQPVGPPQPARGVK